MLEFLFLSWEFIGRPDYHCRRYYDYCSAPYSVTFPAGVATVSFTVGIQNVYRFEMNDKTFFLYINDLLLPEHIITGNIHTAKVIIRTYEGKSISTQSYFSKVVHNLLTILFKFYWLCNSYPAAT